MDYTQTTLDNESVKIISITGSEKNTTIIFIDSNNNLKAKVKPVYWEDFSPVQNKSLSVNSTFVAGTGSAPSPVVSAGSPTPYTIPLSWGAVPGAIDYSVYYKEVTATTWETMATGISGTSQTVADLNPLTNYDWSVVARVLVHTSGSGTSMTLSAAPLTITGRKRILGRSTSYQNDLFGGSGNTSAWWFYGDQSITGPTKISFTHRIQNQTGKTIDKIAIPFFGILSGQSDILGLWIGRGGDKNATTATSYQQLTFDGQTSAHFTDASIFSNTYRISDTLTLDTPWVDDEWLLVRVVFADTLGGKIPTFDSFSPAFNAYSQLTNSWMALGDGNPVSASLNWQVGWEVPYCHVFVEFAETETPELSILAYGDSIINQWKTYADTNVLVRDGWQWRLEVSADTDGKKYHVATAGNGGYEIPQFSGKFTTLWDMYKDWVDVVMYEGWSSNNPAQSDVTRLNYQSILSACESIVTSSGKEWLMIYPAPIGVWTEDANSATIGSQQDATIAWASATYPGRVIDARPGIWNPASQRNNLVPTYSVDDVHQTDAGAINFTSYLKPVLESTLETMGYNI